MDINQQQIPDSIQQIPDSIQQIPDSSQQQPDDPKEEEEEEIQIPHSCDIKDALILKLEEIDNQIHHLLDSNRYFESEISEAKVNGVDQEQYGSYEDMKKEYSEYLNEN